MKKQILEENVSKIEIGISIIEQVSKEANDIFDDVIEEKNLSEYYLKETTFKTMYLKEQLINGLNMIQLGLIEKSNKSKKSGILIPILAVANIFIAKFLPFLALLNSILLLVNIIKDVKKRKEEQTEIQGLEKELYEVTDKANKTLITLSNNETFTLKRIKALKEKKEKELKSSHENISLVDVANMTIQLYIDSDILPTNMPPEIEGTVRRLLQNDLNTKETDIKVLLDSAKEKASLDALVHRME